MSESIWDAFGVTVDEVPDNPFGVPRNTYPVNIDAEVKPFKEGGPEYFVINYEIMSGPYAGKGANKIFPLKPLSAGEDPEWQTKNARTISNLKRTLIELGLNSEQIRAFRLNEQFARAISGIKGTADIGPQKNNDQYNAVYGFTKGEATAPAVSASSVPQQSIPSVPEIPQAASGAVSGSVGSLDGLANLFPQS